MEMAVESMEMAPGAIPRPGRVLKQRLLSPEIGIRWWRRCGTLSGKTSIPLGFSRHGEYIGGRAMSVDARGAHTIARRGQGGAPRGGVATSWPSSVSGLDSVSCPGKIGTSAFVSSNSENISCVAFLKPKTAENMNWHCGILLIG